MKGKLFQQIAVVVGLTAVSGCAHPLMVLHGRDVVITGRNTVQDPPDVATRRVMAEAAQITLNHGYRYFEVLDPIRPGAKVTIRLYGAGERVPSNPNVHDANLMMLNAPKPKEASPEDDIIEQ